MSYWSGFVESNARLLLDPSQYLRTIHFPANTPGDPDTNSRTLKELLIQRSASSATRPMTLMLLVPSRANHSDAYVAKFGGERDNCARYLNSRFAKLELNNPDRSYPCSIWATHRQAEKDDIVYVDIPNTVRHLLDLCNVGSNGEKDMRTITHPTGGLLDIYTEKLEVLAAEWKAKEPAVSKHLQGEIVRL